MPFNISQFPDRSPAKMTSGEDMPDRIISTPDDSKSRYMHPANFAAARSPVTRQRARASLLARIDNDVLESTPIDLVCLRRDPIRLLYTAIGNQDTRHTPALSTKEQRTAKSRHLMVPLSSCRPLTSPNFQGRRRRLKHPCRCHGRSGAISLLGPEIWRRRCRQEGDNGQSRLERRSSSSALSKISSCTRTGSRHDPSTGIHM